MTDISIVILVGNEELHIKRCLEKLIPLEPRQIFVVESQKGDRTHELLLQLENEVRGSDGEKIVFHVWHDYPGNQAAQFNWVLDNLPIEGKWILRLDADEYLLPELIEEIKTKLATISNEVEGIYLKRRHYFSNGWAKRGTYPVEILRLFRIGCGRYGEGMVMDERIQVAGKVIEFDNDFVDHSLITMDEWRNKHRSYAKREAQQVVNGEFHDPRKMTYYKMPPYFRAFAYFCIRYFLKGGFLDGYVGWMWNFWQGLWYRCLVDYEIGKLKKKGRS